MFFSFLCLMILSKIEVLATGQEDKLTSALFLDGSLESFQVNSFLFNNESVHLNITWRMDRDLIEEIAIEGFDFDCTFYSTYNVSGYDNLIVPSLDINPYENIMLGCSYNITITLEDTSGTEGITKIYTVPDCLEEYCACITNLTNLLKLVDVQQTEKHTFKVFYTSQNPYLEKGNYNITGIYYVDENTDDWFNIYDGSKYVKGAIEISTENLKFGGNYTIFIEYRDFTNANPDCEYTSSFNFIVPFSKDDEYLVIKAVSIFIFLFCAFVLLCVFVKRSVFSKNLENIKKFLIPIYEESPAIQTLKKTSFSFPHQEVNTLYTPLEASADPYEIPRENIIVKKDVLGEGEFGKVYYAKAHNLNGLPGFTLVAVKLLREAAPKEEVSDFLAEIKMLKKIGVHKNIVKFLGCVTKTQPYMTIMELVANGNLKEYLIKLREVWEQNNNQRRFFPDDMEEKSLNSNEPKPDSGTMRFDADQQTPLLSEIGTRPEPVLDHTELENFAHQIATGMSYLEKIPVTHRDLAARNILITQNKVLKISDFGMSRSGPYVNRNLKKVPLRWMAIEAIEHFKTDSRSDVWSFGVVLWEIGTLGAFPYEHIPNDLLWKALRTGYRLPRPEICTDELYALMQSCWRDDPKDRPTFADIVEQFKAKKQHVYVDFKRVNPNYVFPPTDPI